MKGDYLRRNQPAPPDDDALRAAIDSAAGWVAITAAYNAATGERRTTRSLKSRACRLRIRITRRALPGPAVQWNTELLARIMAGGPGYREAVERYNAATGESRTAEALKARWKLQCEGLRAGKRVKAGAGGSDRPPIGDPREIQLRVQRLALYRDCHGIPHRPLTGAEFDEAIEGDPFNWPDAPTPNKPGHLDVSQTYREPRTYRMQLPRGRTA